MIEYNLCFKGVAAMVSMDPKTSPERDLLIDLESGTRSIIDEQQRSGDAVSGVGQAKVLNKAWGGFVTTDGLIQGEEAGNSGSHFVAEGRVQNGESSASKTFGEEEEKAALVENKAGAEKKKKKGSKPPKPPRPPKSPSLDAADQKLIREISELAMLKRARMERMKALKKMKNAKASSSNSNLCALVITIIFCIVIIWQGVLSRGCSIVAFQGSPESSVRPRGSLISVQFYRDISTDVRRRSSSASPNNVEQVSGLDDHGEASRTAGLGAEKE